MAFSDFQELDASEKIVLVRVEPSRRIQGWVVHSGNVYKKTGVTDQSIVSISEDGTALTEVSSIAAISAGEWFHDIDNSTLYIETTGSTNPNGVFIVMNFREFYSNAGVSLPFDLSSGSDVHWLALVDKTSDFGVGLDNQHQLGNAIEGSGNVSFINDASYWRTRYDNFFWENKKIYVWLWNQTLAASDARLIYKGRVKGKSFNSKTVKFSMKDQLSELRAKIPLSDISSVSGALVPDGLLEAKQRTIYGYVNGLVPTPIDQIVDGYTLSGTVSLTQTSKTLTGTSTSFLTELSPGDSISITDVADEVTIESVDSDTSITLSQEFDGTTVSGKTYAVVPETPNKRYANRVFLVSGHALKEPSTTVADFINFTKIRVASSEDFLVGDVVVINTQALTISTITGDFITFSTVLNSKPAIGDTVKNSSVKNVYIDKDLLITDRDYTVDAANGKITLDDLAEFNVAPVKTLTGTISLNTGSRVVSGSSTLFTSELKPSDWIKTAGQATYFEVLSIESDLSLTLRSLPTYTDSGNANYKTPNYYEEGVSVLSCDVLGKTVEGTKTGTFIKTGPGIVEDLLKTAGLTSDINTTSFTTAKAVARQRVGIAIPNEYTKKDTPEYKKLVNMVNESIFGTLKQNTDFQFAYDILEPDKDSDLSVNEADVLSFKVDSKSDKIVQTVVVEYDNREYDRFLEISGFTEATTTSDVGAYLTETKEEFRVNTILVDSEDSDFASQRYAFFKELSTSVISFDAKMRAADLDVNDKVVFSHQLIYDRLGSSFRSKIGAIQQIKRSATDVSIELEDLGNAFTRASAITTNSSLSFDDAGDSEKIVNGYMTDVYGLIDNDGDTANIHLIS